jgi:G:T-mismatch repair DNA endonuclease (very short patch repair protein)
MGYRVLIVWQCELERKPAATRHRIRRMSTRGALPSGGGA